MKIRRKSNKGKKVFSIILCLILLGAGIFCLIYFTLDRDFIKYYNVKLGENTAEISLNANKTSLAPNDNIISRPVKFSLDKTSENSYVRAKIVFENESTDSRVLSFISQLNYNVKNFETYENFDYCWQFVEEDNCFYLITLEGLMKVVSSEDRNITFIEKLVVPNTIKQMSTLNDESNNVQIGEDIVIHITFEAVQANIPIKNSEISSVSEYFNMSANQYENGFYSLNGFITGCDLTNQETLILPKKVGNDYIVGIKTNAFENTNVKNIIVPANIIFFEDNAFNGANNLNFVALKNQVNISLQANTFSAMLSQIFVAKDIVSTLKETYSNFSYINNLKQITEISSSDLTKIPSTTQYIYSSTLTEFDGNLSSLTNLKVVDFPVLETINEEMFSNLSNLILVECPNAKVVLDKAFSGCSKLVNVVLSKNLESLGEKSFYGCAKLINADFLKNVSVVSVETFRGCTSLTEVNFENDVEIKSSAFYGCTSLRKVVVNNLKMCENYAFGECSNLRWFFVKSVDGLTAEEKAFSKQEGGANLNTMFVFENENVKNTFSTEFSIPANQIVVIKVENGVLKNFTGEVKNLDLSDFNAFGAISKIGDGAFKNNEILTQLTLPYSVEEIGNNAFDGATKLVKITINSYIPPKISETTFENASENLYVYVPEIVLNVYKQTYENLFSRLIAK